MRFAKASFYSRKLCQAELPRGTNYALNLGYIFLSFPILKLYFYILQFYMPYL